MKDAYYFKHDSNAGRDLKIMQIKAIYGHEGIGFFWSVIEILREQADHSWDEKQVDILAKIIDADSKRFSNFLADCKRIGLLKLSSKGKLFSQRLTSDMKIWENKRLSGKKGGEAKIRLKHSKTVANYLAKDKRIASELPTSIGEYSIGEVKKPPTQEDAEKFMVGCGGTKSQGRKFWLYYTGKTGWDGVADWTALAQKWFLTDSENGKEEKTAKPRTVIT